MNINKKSGIIINEAGIIELPDYDYENPLVLSKDEYIDILREANDIVDNVDIENVREKLYNMFLVFDVIINRFKNTSNDNMRKIVYIPS